MEVQVCLLILSLKFQPAQFNHRGFINFFIHYLIGGVSEPLSSNFNEELLALLPILERGPPLGTLASDSDTEYGLMAFLTLVYLSHFLVPVLVLPPDLAS